MKIHQSVWPMPRCNPLLFVMLVILLGGVVSCNGTARETANEPSTAASPTRGQETEIQMSGNAERGATLYTTCSGCHGAGGIGVDGVGVALTQNDFIATHSDRELVDYIIAGRAADTSDNRSGLAMPPSGGNPSLSEQNLYDIAAFLRTLEGNR